MSAARHKDRHPAVVLLALALLAIPGFGIGVLAGVAWEAPGLLVSHLLGRTVEVPWGSAAREGAAGGEEVARIENAPASRTEEATAARALPDVAAAAPERAASAPAPSATRLRPDVLSPGASELRFAVQVGAFGESSAAEALAERLRAKGFDVYVSPSAPDGGARWRVRVGPLPTREQADRAAARLKAEEKLPTWVLDENAV
ncbi:MAG: SPOR domain-containing protein [Myxococcota bacterium]|nr:SPOR domain-containing protein [Myxococcota bacterium]